MWKGFQQDDKHQKNIKNMKNDWFPTKIVFFVDVTVSKTYYLVWKRHKTDFKCSKWWIIILNMFVDSITMLKVFNSVTKIKKHEKTWKIIDFQWKQYFLLIQLCQKNVVCSEKYTNPILSIPNNK